MLLAVDIGNTNIVCGLFDGNRLKARWRVQTSRLQTSDDLGQTALGLLHLRGYRPEDLNGAIIASVVPPLTVPVRQMIEIYFGITALVVGPGIQSGLTLGYEDPRQLGSDRLANAVAAWTLYGGPAIVVDMGTATKFEAITADGQYLGGAIAPGLRIASEALFSSASRLYRVELIPPRQAIGRNITASLQSGLMYGYIALVERMIRRIATELMEQSTTLPEPSFKLKVVATGGLSHLIDTHAGGIIDHFDPDLTLQGLCILYERNNL